MNMQCRYGSFLVIPLKYSATGTTQGKRWEQYQRISLTTMDINENVKNMFNTDTVSSIGSVYRIPEKRILQALSEGTEAIHSLQVKDDQGDIYHFSTEDSVLYVFHTGVAFLCLRMVFDQIQALNAICCPGYAKSTSQYYWIDSQGKNHDFDVDRWLERLCRGLGLSRFFEGNARFLLEAYTYTLAVFPEYFSCMEEMKKLTFNLHQMIPAETATEEYSEEDVRFVYAVKNEDRGAYRWGCCITSQTCSYVTANQHLDVNTELNDQENDGLPVVVLALYEKYTCLRFTQRMAEYDHKKGKKLQELKNAMLEFQAYGTVSPANLSRWHNVKQIYAAVLELNDVSNAVEDVAAKMSIVTERQQEVIRNRNESIINIITIFGIVSIVASVLSIVQILSDGNPVFWVSTILTSLAMTLVLWLAMHLRR